MQTVLFRSIPLVGATLLLSGCIIGDGDFSFGPSDRYQTDFHHTYDVSPDAHLSLESFNGPVEIAGWDENRIEISGTKYGSTERLRDDLRIDIHNTQSSVEIRTVRPYARTGGMGARYTIHVPRNAQLDRITTSNGSLRIRDVASADHLKSSNGSIRVENVSGNVEAHTSNASVEADSIRGNANLKSSNGRIRAENIGGSCDAETSNNSIKVQLQNAPSLPLRMITSNGSIELSMDKAPKNDVRAETRNGGITLRLPASTSARLTADTTNSSISSDFSVHGDEERKHVEGNIGEGGPHIDLNSKNGKIRIVKGAGD